MSKTGNSLWRIEIGDPFLATLSLQSTFPLYLLSYLNFHPLEVVSRYRDPQRQVGENYYMFNLRPNIYTSLLLNTHSISNYRDLISQQNRYKTIIVVVKVKHYLPSSVLI